MLLLGCGRIGPICIAEMFKYVDREESKRNWRKWRNDFGSAVVWAILLDAPYSIVLRSLTLYYAIFAELLSNKDGQD